MKRVHTLVAVLLLGLMSVGVQAQQRADDLAIDGQPPSASPARPLRQDHGARAGGTSLRDVNEAARSGDLARARSLIDEILQRQPDNARAHFVKAQLASRDKDIATARSELQTAEKLAPGLPFAREQAVTNLRTRLERLEAREGRADRPRAGRNARDRDATPPAEVPAESRTPPHDTATPVSAGSAGSAVETRPAGGDTRNMGATAEPKVQGVSTQLIVGLLIGAVIAVALMALFRRRRSTQA